MTISAGYLGDFAPGDVIDFKFTTLSDANAWVPATPISLALMVYRDNETTESNAGLTLSTPPFDSRTGLNHVRITTASDASFYDNGHDYAVVITAGTVGGNARTGTVVSLFSIGHRPAPAAADSAGVTTLLSRIGSALTITAGKVDVNDKTGFALSSAGVQALWDALTSALTTAGSIGKLLVDMLNATIGSRLASASYTAPDNAGIAAIQAKTDQLPADPASTSQVNTRLATAGYTAPDNAGIAAIQERTDNLPDDPADESSLQATLSTLAAYVDTEVAAIKAKTDNLPADPASNTQVNTRLATTGYTAPDNSAIAAIQERTDRLPDDPASETTVLTRLATAGYTAPDNAGVAAIQAKTDTLPADPASNTQVNTRLAAADYDAPDNTGIAAVQAQTDQLVFTTPGQVDARLTESPSYSLSADDITAIHDAIRAMVVESEGAITLQQAMSLMLAVMAGVTSGGGLTFKTPNGTATRVVATVDSSDNRLTIVLTPAA